MCMLSRWLLFVHAITKVEGLLQKLWSFLSDPYENDVRCSQDLLAHRPVNFLFVFPHQNSYLL